MSKICVCMYVSEICAEGIFVTFPWWLKNVKSRSKIALFPNERHFEIWFPNKRTITFFWSKLCRLHKKDPTLHVATAFSLEQGETRTSHGPIPHPLKDSKFYDLITLYETLRSCSNCVWITSYCFGPGGYFHRNAIWGRAAQMGRFLTKNP